MKLEADDFENLPAIKSNILSFYSNKDKHHESSRKKCVWKRTAAALDKLAKK